MTRGKSDDQATRQRLIEVGTRQFGAFGYKHVTIRAICKDARANVAAVNYHFHGKLGLYREVLETAFAAVSTTTERAINEGRGKSAEEKLRAYIRVHCETILAASGPSSLQQLIHREMQEPTIGLDDVLERTFKPRFEYLFGVLGELLVLPADDPRVRLSGFSIHGLILMFRPNPVTERVGSLLKIAFTPEQVAEHLMVFALAGLDAYRPWRGLPRARSRRAVHP